ncbi:fused MFS/spermidine synthase [Polaromonas sp.]|uniref:fused MFS/spermidine synthase n=1 Tax=Polaromonas sp. TaxID=1869339 RepID=UPI0018204888|nr:fused MFS/spermidine synthase [Polaromonas sp.]NMM07341.1 fused MFS/spermidine synthase [Polaromonas sp.]
MTSAPPFRPTRSLFYLVFALSGFSGLIYESIWTHYLKLFLGHAAYAQTLVLVIFMGGMALGSWLCAKMSGRWRNLLVGYAAVEGIVGLCAMVFPGGFVFLTDWFFTSVSPAIGAPAGVLLAKWSLAALLILPQSVLLGMTFPLMSAGMIRRFPESSGKTIATLYFANSIGGAIGVLASGFWLIKAIGLPGTVMAAGAINLALAAAVWLMCKRQADAASLPVPVPLPLSTRSRPAPLFLPVLLSVALLTGLSSFAYEISWIRMLSLVLGSSTHAFELMLSTFITGLALGGLWVSRKIDSIPAPLSTLGWIQIAMGVLALATLPLYGQSFGIMEWLIAALPKTGSGYNGFNAASHAIASVIMLPATFFAGMTLPLITHILIKAGTGERSIGFVYSANTLGAIAGVLLAVHVGLPLIGLKGLIVSGAVIDMALGIYLLWRWQTPRLAPRALGALSAAVLLAVALSLTGLDQKQMAAGVFRNNQTLKRINDIAFYQDGKTSSIAVTRSADNVLALRTNGKADASIDLKPDSYQIDETTMALAAALPLVLKPDTRTVANIGLGSGMTTHTLLASAAVSGVDTIEIEPAVREGAKTFKARNHRAFADPRSKIIIEDAKTYFSSHRQRYDLIVSEPSNPWVSGVSGLFSVEFYRLLKRHLAEDGLFVQWLQLYEIDMERVVSVMKALDENFSDYAIYATNFGDAVIIATPKGALPEIPATLPDMPLLRAELKRLDIITPQDLAIRKLGSKKLFAPWLAKSATPANSDYYPYLDQHASRDRFMGSNSFELVNLSMASLPLVEMLGARLPWRETSVSSAPHWQRPHPAVGAMVLRDLLMQVPLTMPPAMRPGDWHNAVAGATQIVEACNAPPNGDAVHALLNFAFDAIPYLRPEENARLMQAISKLACVTMLKQPERLWLNLMDAVGQRDGQGIAGSVDALLGAGLDTTPARKRYLLALGMLGNLSVKRAAEARKIWQTLAPQLYGETPPPLLFKIMAAWSGV